MSKKNTDDGYVELTFEEFEELANMQTKTCDKCEHCIYVEQGDMICDMDNKPKIVFLDWNPTDSYMWCYSKYYKEK